MSIQLENISQSGPEFLQALREIDDAQLSATSTYSAQVLLSCLAWANERRRHGINPTTVAELIESVRNG